MMISQDNDFVQKDNMNGFMIKIKYVDKFNIMSLQRKKISMTQDQYHHMKMCNWSK